MVETHPEKRLIGYARVSTYGQTLDSQLGQLRAAGCNSRNIYREKVTGARADRRELNRMLGKLAPGDIVTVTRIDRLVRSTFDLFGIVKRIVDAKAQFRSLAEQKRPPDGARRARRCRNWPTATTAAFPPCGERRDLSHDQLSSSPARCLF
jgi:DNA invertase Pin-like site-specific DNA recombinase